METGTVVYKRKTADAQEILEHLRKSDNSFLPALTKRVNIEEYAWKIFEKAITFEAWYGDILVGLLAAYFSNNAQGSAFITNVSVVENFMGLGIASQLLKECKEYAVRENFQEIKLEVNKENIRAIRLYGKFNFAPDEMNKDILTMRLELITPPDST